MLEECLSAASFLDKAELSIKASVPGKLLLVLGLVRP